MGVSFGNEESVWIFIFDILCVRVTAEGEVGYGLVTKGITGG